jgi:Glycosyltransferase family 87
MSAAVATTTAGRLRHRFADPRTRRVVRDALTLAGVAALVLTIAGAIPFHGDRIGWSYARDLYAYWVADPGDPYANPVGVGFAYLYSPLFLQVTLPLKLLPFDVVAVIWLIAGLAALWWLGALWMLVIPGVSSDLLLGNINVFIAVAIVLALQRPAWWAFALLTKLSPAVGGLWHLVRGEWRAVGWSALVVSALVGISFAIQPAAWIDWVDLLLGSLTARGASTSEFGPLTIRLPLAAAIVVIGALTRRAWTLPIAALVAMPVIWPATIAVLTAIPRLARPAVADSRAPVPEAP